VSNELIEDFKNDPHAEEAMRLWPENYENSQRNLKKLSTFEQQALIAKTEANHQKLASLFRSGLVFDNAEVQQEISNHYGWVSSYWTPNAKAYAALGQMYVADERFRANYDKYTPGLAMFLRDAMTFFANANLD
jgi:hypothetical protein